MRRLGSLAMISALVALVWMASVAAAGRGNGCSDGAVVAVLNHYEMSCFGGQCPGQEGCVQFESTVGTTFVRECVCDPTPAEGGVMSDHSGDEFSEVGVSLCKTRLFAEPQGGGQVLYSIDCTTLNCAKPCTPDDDGQTPPAVAWCNCP